MSALINDLLHSFCYCIRTGTREFPFVLRTAELHSGRHIWPASSDDLRFVEPLASYGFRNSKNYLHVMQCCLAMMGFCRVLTAAERGQLLHGLEKHYGIRARQAGAFELPAWQHCNPHG